MSIPDPQFPTPGKVSPLRPLPKLIFASRWLQAPLYVGLIVAQIVYVWQFLNELWHLVLLAVGADGSVADVGTHVMIAVLGLIDVVMVANLVIMVVIGGYETFVSRLDLGAHVDKPEWLDHMNAGVLKIKLGTALIGISSVHLLKTFIEIRTPGIKIDPDTIRWQIIIHLAFIVSAIFLAWTDKIMMSGAHNNPKTNSP